MLSRKQLNDEWEKVQKDEPELFTELNDKEKEFAQTFFWAGMLRGQNVN